MTRKVRVRGRSFLTRTERWQVFGYDVSKEAVDERHRCPPRLLRVLVLGLVLAVAAAVVPDSAVKSTELNLVKVHRAEGVDLNPDVVWILAVGSDARPGQDMLRSRGDALQLVGLNAKTGAATAIGIPRDSWVSILGYGSNKVNAALAFGGPDLLGRAVGNWWGSSPTMCS